MKKAADLAKREKKKEEARHKKVQESARSTDIWRLAIGNRQMAEVGSFRALLSDPIRPDVDETDDPATPTSAIPIVQTAASKKAKARGLQQIQESRARKKSSTAATAALASRLQRQTNLTPRSITSPPVQMELIRPGKRKVKVTAHAVESTPPKRMRART